MFFLAFLIMSSCSGLLKQFTHVHFSSQNLPIVKHSQYIFKHFVFAHLHVVLAVVDDLCLITSRPMVESLDIVFLPGPLVFFLPEESGDSRVSFLSYGCVP